jgi:hypothetical protein
VSWWICCIHPAHRWRDCCDPTGHIRSARSGLLWICFSCGGVGRSSQYFIALFLHSLPSCSRIYLSLFSRRLSTAGTPEITSKLSQLSEHLCSSAFRSDCCLIVWACGRSNWCLGEGIGGRAGSCWTRATHVSGILGV